ncbi:eCIS core domain-containing protein [Laspinema olomoucense]|uniref:eCIS core domain-containing protein n=1 Tax=Laspinema olomoucense TaxID=3231600 RepID=UPI0021BB1643|nr:DUF4157 domain-containing protein [Laspinema sp. D3a]MCT7989849.1 DUF4157 domain-containing protein [Laspinema sp. D3a]
MASGRQIQKKGQSNATQTPATGMFKPRPFAMPAEPEAATAPELQTKAEPGQIGGSRLSRIDVSAPPPIQPKLTIGAPDDKYEQEADTIARKVVKQISTPTPPDANGGGDAVQRQMFSKPSIMRLTVQRREALEGGAASSDLESTISQARSSGTPLGEPIRRQMEGAFGADFSGVRVHTNNTADTLNRSLSARAFTTGNNIFFKQGEYNPSSSSGKELLAHELTHVVQQSGGQIANQVVPTGGTVVKRKAQLNSAALQKQAQNKTSIQRLTTSQAPIVQPKAKGSLNGVVQRGVWGSVKSGATKVGGAVVSGAKAVGRGIATGAKYVGKGIATGAKAVGKGIGHVVGFVFNAGAWVAKSIINTVAGGIQRIFNLFNLPKVIKAADGEKAGLFDDVRARWQEVKNTGLSGGTRTAAFLEILSILAGDIRDIAGAIALVSGLIGLIPGAQPALAVAGIAGSISYWANMVKLAIDGVMGLAYIVGNAQYKAQNEDRHGRIKRELIGDMGGFIGGGIAGGLGGMAGGKGAGEAFMGGFIPDFGAAGNLAEQGAGTFLGAVGTGFAESQQGEENEKKTYQDSTWKKDAENKLQWLIDPLEGLKKTWEGIKEIFGKLAEPFVNFWNWIKSLFGKAKEQEQNDPNKGGQENPEDKNIGATVTPQNANASANEGTSFIGKVSNVSDATIKGISFVVMELKAKKQALSGSATM